MADDAIYEDVALGRVLHGPSEIASFVEEATRSSSDFRFESVSLFTAGNDSIYGLERSGATTALVMELVEGPTLADRIDDAQRRLLAHRLDARERLFGAELQVLPDAFAAAFQERGDLGDSEGRGTAEWETFER
jgi:hypothetical protein